MSRRIQTLALACLLACLLLACIRSPDRTARQAETTQIVKATRSKLSMPTATATNPPPPTSHPVPTATQAIEPTQTPTPLPSPTVAEHPDAGGTAPLPPMPVGCVAAVLACGLPEHNCGAVPVHDCGAPPTNQCGAPPPSPDQTCGTPPDPDVCGPFPECNCGPKDVACATRCAAAISSWGTCSTKAWTPWLTCMQGSNSRFGFRLDMCKHFAYTWSQ